MNAAFREFLATQAVGELSHISLRDGSGIEIQRQPAGFTAEGGGTIRPSSNITFAVPAGTTVGSWRAFNSGTGGTDYDGASLPNETYTNAGQYILEAAQTAIHIQAPS